MAKKTHHLNFTSPLLGFANLRVKILADWVKLHFWSNNRKRAGVEGLEVNTVENEVGQ